MTDPAPLSPCIRQCSLDPDRGICTGCLRTLDEITAWSRLDHAARQAIMADLPARRVGDRAGS